MGCRIELCCVRFLLVPRSVQVHGRPARQAHILPTACQCDSDRREAPHVRVPRIGVRVASLAVIYRCSDNLNCREECVLNRSPASTIITVI